MGTKAEILIFVGPCRLIINMTYVNGALLHIKNLFLQLQRSPNHNGIFPNANAKRAETKSKLVDERILRVPKAHV